ncbi:MAG: 4-phosphoerythronate dehydrogenase, partial [Gammaproteobacteria bacterium]|nr:4-phosphoerythronate dehydrogenase [Gammaproteobacteria bacterium]
MKIIADADILDVSKSLSDLGELELISGREIQARHLADADALIVRSITQVDESLLKNSKIRFVGTATSGSNHIDTEYLSRNG